MTEHYFVDCYSIFKDVIVKHVLYLTHNFVKHNTKSFHHSVVCNDLTNDHKPTVDTIIRREFLNIKVTQSCHMENTELWIYLVELNFVIDKMSKRVFVNERVTLNNWSRGSSRILSSPAGKNWVLNQKTGRKNCTHYQKTYPWRYLSATVRKSK